MWVFCQYSGPSLIYQLLLQHIVYVVFAALFFNYLRPLQVTPDLQEEQKIQKEHVLRIDKGSRPVIYIIGCIGGTISST